MVKNRELFGAVKMAYLSDADRCRAMQENRIGGKIGGKKASPLANKGLAGRLLSWDATPLPK